MNQSTSFKSEHCTNIHQQYTFVEKLGEGSFGHIWRVQNNSTGQTLACKLVKSELKKEKALLLREIKILQLLKGITGISQIRAYGQDSQYTFFMMDIHGINLETLRLRLQTFSVPLLLEYSLQILERIQALHAAGVLHRDVKPENFVLTRNDDKTVVVIDFGLSKVYLNNSAHIEFKENKGMIGTARYASINALKGNEQSRRDDLEAIAYMLIYLGQGQLPWMNIREEDKLMKYAKILKMKEQITPEMLTFNLPKVFCELLRYSQALEFEQVPDYENFKSLIRNHLVMQVDRISMYLKRSSVSGPMTQREEKQQINKLQVGQYTTRLGQGISNTATSRQPLNCSSGSIDLNFVEEGVRLDMQLINKGIIFRRPQSTSENFDSLDDEGSLNVLPEMHVKH